MWLGGDSRTDAGLGRVQNVKMATGVWQQGKGACVSTGGLTEQEKRE